MGLTSITTQKQLLQDLWGVPRTTSYRHMANMPEQVYREDGVDLEAALQFRPTPLTHDEFEAVVAKMVGTLDGVPTFAPDVARYLGLHCLYSVAPRPERAARAARQKPDLPPLAKAEAGMDRVEKMSELRLAKLRGEIEARKLRTAREEGELVSKAAVLRDLKAAGVVVQSTLGLLPARIAALVPVEMRAEAMRLAENAVERSLQAIVAALGDVEDVDE